MPYDRRIRDRRARAQRSRAVAGPVRTASAGWASDLLVDARIDLAGIALEHLDLVGCEQDVVDRHDLEQQVDTRLVIDAGVEEDVVGHDLVEFRAAGIERNA